MKKALLLILFMPFVFSKEITKSYNNFYKNKSSLSIAEIKKLQNTKIILIPGILFETFHEDDQRTELGFSKLVGNYLQRPLDYFPKKYKLETQRLSTSSSSLEETKKNIELSLKTNKEVVFITHSLGGLVLLDYLLDNRDRAEKIKGIIFLQSPFHGSPMADIYRENPFYIRSLLRNILPFFNTTEEVIDYLSVEKRSIYMEKRDFEIKEILKEIPSITVGTVANNSLSLFHTAVNIMKDGCMNPIFSKCPIISLYKGKKDFSDGMVPLESSKLEGADFIKIHEVDHGETVVDIPFMSIEQNLMYESLLKALTQNLR